MPRDRSRPPPAGDRAHFARTARTGSRAPRQAADVATETPTPIANAIARHGSPMLAATPAMAAWMRASRAFVRPACISTALLRPSVPTSAIARTIPAYARPLSPPGPAHGLARCRPRCRQAGRLRRRRKGRSIAAEALTPPGSRRRAGRLHHQRRIAPAGDDASTPAACRM